jgi:trypsin-like peptidase
LVIAKDVDLPEIVRQAKPAVVQITALDKQNKPFKAGTGFFISSDGNLLTNYHVISGASSIIANTPSGAVYILKEIVAVSPQSDVALLRFYVTDVPHLDLTSSTDAVEGQRVLVIGNPEGLEGTVSDGIISAFRKNRSMIQITAPVVCPLADGKGPRGHETLDACSVRNHGAFRDHDHPVSNVIVAAIHVRGFTLWRDHHPVPDARVLVNDGAFKPRC